MKILRVDAKNFKGAKQVGYVFGENVRITGDNYTGKTSVAEAIVFALYGVNLDGSSRTDALLNKDSKKAEIILSFELDGKAFEITREQTRQKKVFLNGVPTSQTEIEAIIGPLEHFLVAFWPTHILGMKDKDAREFFMKFVESIEPAQVLDEMDEIFREPLSKLDMRNPEGRKKELNAEIKEAEDDLLYIEGAVAAHTETLQLEVPSRMDPAEAEQKLTIAEQELFESKTEKPALVDTAELERKVKECERNLYTGLPKAPEIQDISPLEQVLREAERKLYHPDTLLEPKAPDTTSLQQKVAELRAEYKVLQKQITELKAPFAVGDTCPTCQQEIGERAYESFAAQIEVKQSEMQARITEIEQEGKQLNERISALKAEYEANMTVYESKKDNLIHELQGEVQKATEALREAREANTAALALYEEVKVQISSKWQQKLEETERELQTAVAENEKRIAQWENKELERTANLRQQRADLQQQLEVIRKANAEHESLTERKAAARKAIEQLQKTAENDRNIIEKNNLAIKAINEYIAKHAEMQAQQIEQYFTNVSIKLFDVVKTTGEIKPVFKLLYNEKPIGILSLSERIRLGLEVAGMIKQVTGRNYPTFIDNAESITHFNAIPGQLFTATVVAGQALEVAI